MFWLCIMSNVGNYNQILTSLADANRGFVAPDVWDDRVNDAMVFAKSATEGISSQLIGYSSLKTIAKAAGFAKSLGASEEAVDGMKVAASQGDVGGMVTSTIRAATSAGNRLLGNGIRQTNAAVDEFVGGNFVGSQKATVSDPFTVEPGDSPFSVPRPLGQTAGGAAPDVTDADVATGGGTEAEVSTVAKAAADVDKTAETLVAGGGEIDPFELAGAAVLGVVGMILGRHIKTHKVVNTAGPGVATGNYQAQLF